jgi:hypothetical protein
LFNLIEKKIVNHPGMEQVVKGNKTLVNYFSTAGSWRKQLTTWQKENGIKHGLQTLCDTKWYSMEKVCLGVHLHEVGFQKCLEQLCSPILDTPSMAQAVIEIINDQDHFTTNQTLVSLLIPVVHAIGILENAHSTLANIWKELLVVIGDYKKISKIDVYS